MRIWDVNTMKNSRSGSNTLAQALKDYGRNHSAQELKRVVHQGKTENYHSKHESVRVDEKRFGPFYTYREAGDSWTNPAGSSAGKSAPVAGCILMLLEPPIRTEMSWRSVGGLIRKPDYGGKGSE